MLLSILLLSISTSDAVPLQLTQQGRMLDANGSAVTGLHILTFRVYDDVNTGNMLWEDYMTADFVNGYYAAVLGADVQNNPLDSSVLSLYPLYLEIQLDNNSPLSPRTEISSVPYSQIAGIAESVEGGTVDASEISIGGNAVIDSNGLWVGQPLTVDWANVQNIPSDIADGDANTQLSETQVEGYINNGAIDLHPLTTMNGSGLLTQADTLTPDWTNITNRPAGLDDGDDDALAGLGCAQGEIVGWDGVNWVCTSDNNLSESEVEAYITNSGIDLAAGSTMAGQDLLTSDSDTLAGLNCLDTEIPRYDSIAQEWYCASDGLAQKVCSDGEVMSYNASTANWDCTSFQSLLDADSDGVMAWADCNDNDNTVGSSAFDNDCDGFTTNDDCNDYDPNSNAVVNDNDCDGTLTADDCDDNNANSTIVSTDADCDGYVTSLDCNDNDSTSTIVATDADCDGIITADDCDDTDPNITTQIGTIGCPAQSCNDILVDDPTSPDGAYYLNPDNLGTVQVYCDMTLDDGGWTLVYINNPSNPLDINNIDEQGTISNLTSPSGDSAKLADTYINSIRGNSDQRVGYRVTSNDITTRYFAPSYCSYVHTDNNSSACRNYVSPYSASMNPSYIQCVDWGGGSGGLDAWYGCNGNGGGYTNVFNTHKSYSESAGITTNAGGSFNGNSGTDHGNDVLMWVR